MNPLEHVYDKAKESWHNKIDSLYMEADPEKLQEILDTIKADHLAFQHLAKYKELFPEPAEHDEPQNQNVLDLEEVEEAPVAEPVVEEIMPSYKIARSLRGAMATLIGSEALNKNTERYYITEFICLKMNLNSGAIVKGHIKEGRLMIEEVTLETPTSSDPMRRTYDNCLVMIDKGGQMYANRHVDGSFVKDEKENFIRLNISQQDRNHFQLEEGDVIHIAEDKKTKNRIVSLKAETVAAVVKQPVEPKKKVKPDKNVKTPADKREDLFRSLPCTPDTVRSRSVAIYAPERLHQRFIDTLEILCGMRVRMVGEDSKQSEIISAVQQSEFFIIAAGNTDGAFYKRLRAVSEESDTQFRTLSHAGVSETLRNIVDMILAQEIIHI